VLLYNHYLATYAMVPGWITTAASVGMAFLPPLVYVDQAVSIQRKKWVYSLALRARVLISPLFRDATGFSRDVCAIL